jgi:acetyltransferase-like isoleucine patch superfamily enzyme
VRLLDVIGSTSRRLRGFPPRDERQARFITRESLAWMRTHGAYSRGYWMTYWRLFLLRIRRPDIITEGMVFIGPEVVLDVRRGYARLIIGKWVHIGEQCRIRVHEGNVRIGDKCVFGRDVTINSYLDIEIGTTSLIADSTYICDFDHDHRNLSVPIKDQGLVKSPVRIGPDVWIGTKSTVLRGSSIGRGSVVGANSVVKGALPAYSVSVGVPAVPVKSRRPLPTKRPEVKDSRFVV